MANDLVPTGGGLPADTGGHALAPADRETHIRSVMKTDMGRYRREGLDRELAAIEYWKGTAISILPAAQSMSALQATGEGRELVDAWSHSGGFHNELDKVQRFAGGIVRHVGDVRGQRVFMATFDRDVSERARYHIYDELRKPAPTGVKALSAGDLNHFCNTPAGVELFAEWGAAAPMRAARVWARFARFRAALDDDGDFMSFVDWYKGLDDDAVIAICRALAE